MFPNFHYLQPWSKLICQGCNMLHVKTFLTLLDNFPVHFYTRLFSLSPTCSYSFSTDSGKYHNSLLWFLHPYIIMSSLQTKVTYFILNVTVQPVSHNDPIETSQCFMFGKIFVYLGIFGNIGTSNYPFIVNLIICPLVHFSLIISNVGLTLLRWADIAMSFQCILNQRLRIFSSFVKTFCVWRLIEIATYMIIFKSVVNFTITG